jgi:hypothetical protein
MKMKVLLEEQSIEYAKDRCQNFMLLGGPSPDRYDIEQAFEDGANWRINSAWHNTSENPEMAKTLLVEKEDGNISLCKVYKKYTNTNGWKRWAYIEDLLINSEEGKNETN